MASAIWSLLSYVGLTSSATNVDTDSDSTSPPHATAPSRRAAAKADGGATTTTTTPMNRKPVKASANTPSSKGLHGANKARAMSSPRRSQGGNNRGGDDDDDDGREMRYWSPEEERKLRLLVESEGGNLTWHDIAERMPGRNWKGCKSRAYKLGMKKGVTINRYSSSGSRSPMPAKAKSASNTPAKSSKLVPKDEPATQSPALPVKRGRGRPPKVKKPVEVDDQDELEDDKPDAAHAAAYYSHSAGTRNSVWAAPPTREELMSFRDDSD